MAYSLTYATLVAELQTYVDSANSEFVAQLPSIIRRAQDRVQMDLQLAQWRTLETRSLVSGTATTARSATWLKIHSIWVTAASRFAEQRSLDWCRAMSASAANGHPRYWAEYQTDAILLSPTPGGAYEIIVETMARLPALSVDVPTNWISTNAAAMLLYAALAESEGFLISAERKAEFMQSYAEAMERTRAQISGSNIEQYTPIRDVAQSAGGA